MAKGETTFICTEDGPFQATPETRQTVPTEIIDGEAVPSDDPLEVQVGVCPVCGTPVLDPASDPRLGA